MKALLCLLVAAASCAFFSCGGAAFPDLERVSLFEISYGRFDGEIDLFSNTAAEATGGVCPEVCLYMRDGIFYVGNAASRKVLQFTSYGDLLSVYYNPEYSPPPDFQSFSAARGGFSSLGEGEEFGVMTQRAIEYPFNMISAVAADSARRLFVADMLPEERVEYSEDDELMLYNIVIRFDAQGNFIDFLGQEGPGGTPFAAISGLYINSADELLVVALRQDGAEVFWFNTAGRLLYRAPVSADALPSPYNDGRRAISVLSGVIPAYRGGVLYLIADFYLVETDSETGSQSGIRFDRAELYPFYMEQGAFGERMSLPVYEGDEGGRRPYDVIGVTESDRIFLYTPVTGGYEICVVDLGARRIQRRSLSVSLQDQVYNVFHLSDSGILSAILASPDKAQVVWWRADTLSG